MFLQKTLLLSSVVLLLLSCWQTSNGAATSDPIQTFVHPDPTPVNMGFGIVHVRAASDADVLITGFRGNSGVVYLYDARTGDHLQTFLPPTPASRVSFGASVALSGQHVLIGVPADNRLGYASGAAYLFNRQSGKLIHTFLNPTPSEGGYFGHSVALSNHAVLIGHAYYQQTSNGGMNGVAHLFDRHTGRHLHTFLNPTPEYYDQFGAPIAISGDTVVIGAGGDTSVKSHSGAVYLFDARTRKLIRPILNPEPGDWKLFGGAVAVFGNYIVVGAPGHEWGAPKSGAAYLFDIRTGKHIHTFRSPAPAFKDNFGATVAINGDIVVIGAPGPSGEASDPYEDGAVHIFDVHTGDFLCTVLSPIPPVGEFGSSVAISGMNVVVGSLGVPGAAYIFPSCSYVKVPLGGEVTSTANPGDFKVYVPTRWGGTLNIELKNPTSGVISDLRYPDGTPYEPNSETGENNHGWYKFRVTGSDHYTVKTTFTQTGEAKNRPWNFYWWSKHHTPREPSLFSQRGLFRPLEKYDMRHGTRARNWEEAYDQKALSWGGHCYGAAVASIVLKQPRPVLGSAYNRDELEGLWAELGEHKLHDRLGIDEIPAGPPEPGQDKTDLHAPRVQLTLEYFLKSKQQALVSDLRALPCKLLADCDEDQRWNHAVYKFKAVFREADGGDERVIDIENTVFANAEFEPPTYNRRNRKDIYRQNIYRYIITYRTTGEPETDLTSVVQDWISVGGDAKWAPEGFAHIVSPLWISQNPDITEINVRADDAAN